MKIAVDLRPGHRGNSFVTDNTPRTAAAHGGPWSEIDVVEAATFATLDDSQQHNSSSVKTGYAWPAGKILYGNFTAVTLTSGKVILYKGPTTT